jgi:hypothetical protein
VIRPKILQVRGKLGIWKRVGAFAIYVEADGKKHGFGPKFTTLQLI